MAIFPWINCNHSLWYHAMNLIYSEELASGPIPTWAPSQSFLQRIAIHCLQWSHALNLINLGELAAGPETNLGTFDSVSSNEMQSLLMVITCSASRHWRSFTYTPFPETTYLSCHAILSSFYEWFPWHQNHDHLPINLFLEMVNKCRIFSST